MLHITMLALATIVASNAFADHQPISIEAHQNCPDGSSTMSCEKDKVAKLRNPTDHRIRLAAVDTQDEPRCAADGVCNLAVCSAEQDPDCPKDLPPGAGADPATTPAVSLETVDCTSTQSVDILAVAWNLVDDWANFERTVESATGSSLGNCIRNRFRDNGRVICEQQTNCNNRGRCVNGRASPLNRTVRIFGTFFNNIANAAAPDRRACYAALLMHEFSHSCDRVFERPRAEDREAAAFTYWQTRFPGTSGWTRTGTNGAGCGLD